LKKKNDEDLKTRGTYSVHCLKATWWLRKDGFPKLLFDLIFIPCKTFASIKYFFFSLVILISHKLLRAALAFVLIKHC